MTETPVCGLGLGGKKIQTNKKLTGYGTIIDFNTISLFEVCKKDELDSRKTSCHAVVAIVNVTGILM